MTVRLQQYCADRHVGAPLSSISDDTASSFTLPAAVLQYRATLDSAQLGSSWPAKERDETTEIVVPISVFPKLGKDVYAGQLVYIKSPYSGSTRHIARLVPSEAVASHMLSEEACEALQINEEKCTTASGQEIALVSPILAFNLGLPFAVAEVMLGQDMSSWLSKRNSVTISPVESNSSLKDAADHQMTEAWVPSRSSKSIETATYIGLSHLERPQKNPPFSIVDYQDNLQAAAQAMSGAPPKPADDELEDTEIDDLSAEQHKQRESDTMAVRLFGSPVYVITFIIILWCQLGCRELIHVISMWEYAVGSHLHIPMFLRLQSWPSHHLLDEFGTSSAPYNRLLVSQCFVLSWLFPGPSYPCCAAAGHTLSQFVSVTENTQHA